MTKSITIQISQDWIAGLPKEELTLQHIFHMGIYQYKVKQAIQLYQDKIGSLGYISEKIGISKRDLICEFRQRGIEPDFSQLTLQEEFGK